LMKLHLFKSLLSHRHLSCEPANSLKLRLNLHGEPGPRLLRFCDRLLTKQILKFGLPLTRQLGQPEISPRQSLTQRRLRAYHCSNVTCANEIVPFQSRDLTVRSRLSPNALDNPIG